MSEKLALKFWPLVLIIAFAAFSRFLLLGVHNVSPIAAIALFGGAYFAQKHWAYLIPVAAMWITDIFLNNTVYAQYYDGFVWFGNLWVYAAFLLVVLLGQGLLKKIKPLHVLFAAVGSFNIIFYCYKFWRLDGHSFISKNLDRSYRMLCCSNPIF